MSERRTALLFLLALLGLVAAHTLAETARDSLFLVHVPITHLPAFYLVIAAVSLLAARAGSMFRRGAVCVRVDGDGLRRRRDRHVRVLAGDASGVGAVF